MAFTIMLHGIHSRTETAYYLCKYTMSSMQYWIHVNHNQSEYSSEYVPWFHYNTFARIRLVVPLNYMLFQNCLIPCHDKNVIDSNVYRKTCEIFRVSFLL